MAMLRGDDQDIGKLNAQHKVAGWTVKGGDHVWYDLS